MCTYTDPGAYFSGFDVVGVQHLLQKEMASAALVAAAASTLSASESSDVYVALGLLSAAGAAEKSNAAQYRARRTKLRQDAQRFECFSRTRQCALRFVLAGARTRSNAPVLAEAHREAAEHGDMLLINTTEGRFTCSRKYLLWLQQAPALFPSAEYIGIGDDDIYIQLDHFVADLRSIRKDPQASRHIFWGLIMWKAYYNNATMVTSTGFTGWGFTDWAAVAQRSQMEACRSTSVNASEVCPGLREDHVEAARLGNIGSPPFPMANGPLAAVSRSLAAAVAQDDYPPRWLDALVKTPKISAALARPGGPRKSSYACWPVVDSILGHWITHAGLKLDEPVTLVNTPLMRQHHPWPSAVRGRFSNSSIILHGLKKPQHERFRDLAIERGMGPFEPFVRECGTCKGMGWSTWPSPLNSWRCCGSKVEPRTLSRACRGRQCPRAPIRSKSLSRSASPSAALPTSPQAGTSRRGGAERGEGLGGKAKGARTRGSAHADAVARVSAKIKATAAKMAAAADELALLHARKRSLESQARSELEAASSKRRDKELVPP